MRVHNSISRVTILVGHESDSLSDIKMPQVPMGTASKHKDCTKPEQDERV
jgi:hypothetical protein